MSDPKQQLEELRLVVESFASQLPEVEALLPVFAKCFHDGNKLLTCGNGGSAADALHMAEELVGRYRGNRKALPAVCLADHEIIIPSQNTARVQEIHTWILHVILEHLEAEFAE